MREDWVECTFEDLSLTLKRGPFGGDLKKAFFVDTGFPVYEQQHAINNNFTNIRYYIDEDRYNKLKSCNVGPGDYIVSCSGTMGKIARLPDSAIVGVINQALLRIRINEKIITNDYFLLFFRSNMFQKEILKDSRGSGMQNMAGIKEIKPVKLNLPPLPIQRAIVKKIESLFVHLDSGIADLEKAHAQLKIYRQAVLKKAFEGELTKEWRAKQTDLPTATELLEQIKIERQKHYEQQLADWKKAVEVWEENEKKGKKPGKPKKYKEFIYLSNDDLTQLSILPEKWQWSMISMIAQEMCLGKMLDKKKNEGILKPYLGNINVRWGKFDLDTLKQMRFLKSEDSRYGLKEGDLIICEGGEPGRCAIWKENTEMKIQKALHRVRFFKNCTTSTFVFYFIQYSASVGSLSKYFTGTTIKHLTVQGLSKVLIPVLSLKEQNQIVQEVETRLSVCDNVEATLTVSLEKSKALRQSILKKAFEGKLLDAEEIAACKAEADYEPASVLLEKIKLEKNK